MVRYIFASLATLSLGLSTLSFAAAVKVSGPEKVRKAIDDICGDSWCEGDFQYKFTKVKFDKKSLQTTVLFTMNPYIDAEEVANTDLFSGSINLTKFDVSCVVKGYADPALIVKENGSLDETFYTNLGSCINSLENALLTRLK